MKNCLECLGLDIEDDALTCPFCGGGSWPDVSVSETKSADAEKDAAKAKPAKKRGDG